MTTVSKETIKTFQTNINKIFKENLLFAFIGGSVANGIDKPTSDIDTFIVTKTSNKKQENIYYQFFKKMHNKLNRSCDHPGFIVSLATLYNLFFIFEQYGKALPDIKQTPCVKEDCILSQYSNAKVMLWFFQDKQIILKDHPLLHAFNSLMQNYKEQVSYDKSKKYQEKPVFQKASSYKKLLEIKHKYEAMILTDSVKKTPWGINTKHFFYPQQIHQSFSGNLKTDFECPMCDKTYPKMARKIIASQCIGIHQMKNCRLLER